MWLIFAGRCRDRHSSRPGFERASIFLLLLNSYESVCVCVCWIIYIFFVNNNNLFLYERQFTCFFLIFVLRVFELVFFLLFLLGILKMNLMVKKDCSLSRVLFLLFFLSFSFSLEPATRRRLITNNCSFPVTSCASVLPLHSLSLASEHNSRLFVVLRINTILLSSCFFVFL